MECYGTKKYNRQEACQSCELAVYCKDAHFESGNVQEFNEENGSILSVDPFEVMELDADLVTADSADSHKENPVSEAYLNCAYELRYFMSELVRLCDANPVRVYALIAKMGGLTLSEIGATCGMSKQGIHKHCQKICASSPELRRFLRMRFSNDEIIHHVSRQNSYQLRKNDGRRNRKTN